MFNPCWVPVHNMDNLNGLHHHHQEHLLAIEITPQNGMANQLLQWFHVECKLLVRILTYWGQVMDALR